MCGKMTRIHLPFLLFFVFSLSEVVFAAEQWWEYGHFYQIYPRSFQDSDGDGIGDLNGITQRLSYLKTLNVSGVWLSPVFQSPMKDMGYDISDFTKIHREFGTMADFDTLLARCKELDIKLILDFVPNHTSDQHEWFKKSADPDDPEHSKYKDYYLWHEGKLLKNGTRIPPSNWLGVFSGSAWTWISSRKAFYYHQFFKEQPDLNFRNAAVRREMDDVLRFWLRKGVSGFRIDAVPHLYEVTENKDGMYDDEPLSGECKDPQAHCYLSHIHTQHLNETYELIYQWRSVIDEKEFRNQSRILMTEAYGTIPQMTRYYGKVENGKVVKYGAQCPFNFQLIRMWEPKASDYESGINSWISAMPKGAGIQANWVMGNHDFGRIASRFGTERIDLYNILLKTLPGITVTYYGEEIGMTNVQEVAALDYRFPARTPFQWDDSVNAGFSTNPKTWLPVADNYRKKNVQLQQSQKDSHLKVFQRLVSLRQHPTLKYGKLTVKSLSNVNMLLYKRELENQPNSDVFVVALNLSEKPIVNLDLKSVFNGLPSVMNVTVGTVHANRLGDSVNTSNFGLERFEGIVLVGRNTH